MTVHGGTQKITMGRDRRQDHIDAQNAIRQAGENSYIQGVQSGIGGIGDAVRGDRTVYGNSNIPVNQLVQGNDNFSYTDTPGNQPMADRMSRTGSVDTQVSSTSVPQQDPDEMETAALSNRLAMMAKGGQGFPGLNNRNREV
jgi:hypothetical protein